MTKENQSIPLRAHHLRSAEIIIKTEVPRECYAANLVIHGYIPDANHPFVTAAFDGLVKLFSDKTKLVSITEGSDDFICASCPLRNTGKRCSPNDPNYDRGVAKDLGIKIGKTYSVDELRRILEL